MHHRFRPRACASSSLSALVSASMSADDKEVRAATRAAARRGSGDHQLFSTARTFPVDGERKRWSVEEGVIVGKNTEPVDVSTYLF